MNGLSGIIFIVIAIAAMLTHAPVFVTGFFIIVGLACFAALFADVVEAGKSFQHDRDTTGAS